MTGTPLRCHLLIGPPGSGKTTLAHQLAPLLQGADGGPGLVLSTDVIRAELFGDAGFQGPWDEVRTVLLQRLQTLELFVAMTDFDSALLRFATGVLQAFFELCERFLDHNDPMPLVPFDLKLGARDVVAGVLR